MLYWSPPLGDDNLPVVFQTPWLSCPFKDMKPFAVGQEPKLTLTLSDDAPEHISFRGYLSELDTCLSYKLGKLFPPKDVPNPEDSKNAKIAKKKTADCMDYQTMKEAKMEDELLMLEDGYRLDPAKVFPIVTRKRNAKDGSWYPWRIKLTLKNQRAKIFVDENDISWNYPGLSESHDMTHYMIRAVVHVSESYGMDGKEYPKYVLKNVQFKPKTEHHLFKDANDSEGDEDSDDD